MTMQPAAERTAIAGLGRRLGPDVLAAVYALFREEQGHLAAAQPVHAADIEYGDHSRQRLDLYAPVSRDGPVPVLLWVHGGGFLRGEKSSVDHPFNAHAARWAARNGMLGAVMNYRLAPDHGWPAGGEDVGLAVDWLRENGAAHGGDRARIVAMGTSAGAVHVATHLRLREETGLAAAVLLSGLYGFTPLDERDTLYYGSAADYSDRWPKEAMVATSLPLLLAGAEYDPPRFQAEFVGLLAARLERHGVLPRSFSASGHNHFSLAYHLGTADTRLADEVLAFIGDLA
ncbi:alpha/beta hydrolase [Sphingomonas sp. BIUV-7]|uniref:Alpha/beta hydrolase n=1 Tax=Sphingomonas natans TaxID=3063330 RepID=A0ABT8Y821_9SPHN|nr:alpha/beta hydrolase [Sphingomonas sp. BIUV-7]MDO6414147.1 alpha/beta hydrolase [Sphingomonas sp. BIUV-7]